MALVSGIEEIGQEYSGCCQGHYYDGVKMKPQLCDGERFLSTHHPQGEDVEKFSGINGVNGHLLVDAKWP